MNDKNGRDVENKYKDASDKFLSFMKETRLISTQKSKEEEKNIKIDTTNVTNFFNIFPAFFLKVFNKLNAWVDSILANKKYVGFLSFFMALTLCYYVNGGIGVTSTKSIDYINEVPVEVVCQDGYHVIGYDQNVTIQLIGDFGSIQWAKLMDDYKVILNVENKMEGNYDVSYSVEGISSNLNVQVLPENATVNISEKETRSFALGYIFTNQNELDSAYILKDPKLAFLEVEVTSGKTTLDRIAQVVASIDVSKMTESVVDETAPIVALDANGSVLDVEFSHKSVVYDLELITNSKTVPIKLEVVGEVNSDYVLSAITPSISQVTIYGLENNLTSIEYIVAEVNIDGKQANDTINAVKLTVPDGVTKISSKTISVDVKVEEKMSKEIKNIEIKLESLKEGLTAKFIGSNRITVNVTGAKSKIDKLNANSLNAYVDLTDANVGTLKCNIIIANQDESIIYEILDASTVDVAITKE